jgi:hypothetical protein
VSFLSTSASKYLAIVIGAFCLCTFLNVYGAMLRRCGVARFEYNTAFDDDTIAEGQSLIRREKRQQGKSGTSTLL